jgi:hypothetical protein
VLVAGDKGGIMDLNEWPNLVTMLFRQAERFGDKPLFLAKPTIIGRLVGLS